MARIMGVDIPGHVNADVVLGNCWLRGDCDGLLAHVHDVCETIDEGYGEEKSGRLDRVEFA